MYLSLQLAHIPTRATTFGVWFLVLTMSPASGIAILNDCD